MKRIFVVLFSLLFLTGCGLFTKDVAQDCSTGFHLEEGVCLQDLHPEGSFTSSEDIVNLFLAFSEKRSTTNYFWRGEVMFEADMALDGAEAPTNEKGSDDYSETNNQVEGVDEMDNVLTDGKYIYISNYDKIQIILAYTESLQTDALTLVKEIRFDDLNPENGYFYFNGMYVDDDRLIVVGNSNSYTCVGTTDKKEVPREDGDTTYVDYYTDCYYYEYHTTTHVFEYSKEDFTLQASYELSGYFVGSRKINDNLYFVTNEYVPFYLVNNEDFDFSIDDYLPNYRINETEVALTYEDILYIDGTEPSTFTSFFGINLDTQEISSEVVLGEGGYNLYVSTENIYLTSTKWNFNDVILLEMEEATDDGKEYVPEENPYELATSIIKVSMDNGLVDFVANGEVPGIAPDQFAMDEQDGYIRIVTTGNNWWWWGTTTEINNRLLVLDEDLNIVSTLEHIGKEGESVQSTRFVGDYAYVVTYLRTDPFYVIDVSDPLNPHKLSELIIPGFSDYLQPINEDYILGIGYGDNDGGTQGLKISLYDVSDKTNAVVASEIIYPYSDYSYMWTSTVYNHKDLLVSINKGIIALPYSLTTYTSGSYYNWQYHTGVLVLNLNIEDGTISERGRVEHSVANSYDTYVYKSKFISDYLYTISSKYVMVSTLLDPETILNQVQIGESRDIDVPVAVEPVDSVDPEVVCSDGTEIKDGECTTQGSTGDPTIYEEFIHVYSWDEALHQGEDDYLVYAYTLDNEGSLELESYLERIGLGQDYPVYFINVDEVPDGEVDIPDVPALYLISGNVVTDQYVGADAIIQYISE